MHCPVHTSASFGMEVTTIRLRPGGLDPKKPEKPQALFHDARHKKGVCRVIFDL